MATGETSGRVSSEQGYMVEAASNAPLPEDAINAASLTASDTVGCAWHVRATSSALALQEGEAEAQRGSGTGQVNSTHPYSSASASSAIDSPATAPICGDGNEESVMRFSGTRAKATNDVRAENAVRVLLGDDLDEAIGVVVGLCSA